MIEGLQHTEGENKCSVCQTDFTDDEGGMLGYIGILPVAFCPFCYSGICDMVEQLDDREWEGLTNDELKELCNDWKIIYGGFVNQFALAIETKLKEKNSYE